VQRHWPGEYSFAGVTGSPIEPLTPSQGWTTLKRRADHVGRELITIRNAGSRAAAGRSKAPGGAALGGPMSGTIPSHLVARPEPFFSTSLIHPIRNAWVAADRRRFVAVEAGADPVHRSTGVLGIFRQDYLRVSQSERLIRVPGAGPLRLTRAPEGGPVATRRSPVGVVHFRGERGVSGALDLSTGRVTVDSASGGSS